MNSINFSSSDSDYCSYLRYTQREKVANDLGLNLDIFNTSTGSSSEEKAFQLSILDWCQKKLASEEYHPRIAAAKQMLECYFSEESEPALEIEYQNLTSLPENFRFPRLNYLYLNGNDLTSLPKKFHCPMLKSIFLSGNPLQSFPEQLNNHPNLEFIELANCGLDSVPKNLRSEKLRSLNLANNWLINLPEDLNFPELKALNLQDNELTSFPENFKFPKLTELDVSENKYMQKLPVSLRACSCLESLVTWETAIPEEIVNSILNRKEDLRYCRTPDEDQVAVPPDDMRTPPEFIEEIDCFSTLV